MTATPVPASPGGESTESLTGRALAGDRAAFDGLYARLVPGLMAWFQSKLGRVESSPEDLVQELWVRLIGKVSSFDPKQGTIRQWVFGFARNLLHEVLRQAARGHRPVQPRTDGVHLSDVAAEVTSATERAARADRRECLRKLFSELEESERDLLELKIQDHSSQEIAEVLGIAVNTVDKRWQRLRERMATLIPALLRAEILGEE